MKTINFLFNFSANNKMSDSELREIYKGGTDANPGKYYYFCDTGKPVPNQTKRVDGKIVADPDFGKKYLKFYKIVDKPLRKPCQKSVKYDFKNIREEAPRVVKNLGADEIITIAAKCGWKLSHKAIQAIRIWGKSRKELEEYLNVCKEEHSDCNYLDYDHNYNQFLTKFKQQN